MMVMIPFIRWVWWRFIRNYDLYLIEINYLRLSYTNHTLPAYFHLHRWGILCKEYRNLPCSDKGQNFGNSKYFKECFKYKGTSQFTGHGTGPKAYEKNICFLTKIRKIVSIPFFSLPYLSPSEELPKFRKILFFTHRKTWRIFSWTIKKTIQVILAEQQTTRLIKINPFILGYLTTILFLYRLCLLAVLHKILDIGFFIKTEDRLPNYFIYRILPILPLPSFK